MKTRIENIIPQKCLEHKCKTCDIRGTCDLIEKLEEIYQQAEPLTYKPFENIKEIMDGRNKMH